jgi:hypothetical protein
MKNLTKTLEKRRTTGKPGKAKTAEQRVKGLQRSIKVLKAAKAKILYEHGNFVPNIMGSQEFTRSQVNPTPYDQYAYMGAAIRYKQSILEKRPSVLFLPEKQYRSTSAFTLAKAPFE